jgi:hypothetical protein
VLDQVSTEACFSLLLAWAVWEVIMLMLGRAGQVLGLLLQGSDLPNDESVVHNFLPVVVCGV